MLNDLRYTFRSLTRARGFSAAVVLTLALGIGANTAIFSVVRAVMLKPLPHRDGERMMYLRQSADGPGHENVAFSVPEIRDLRERVMSLGLLLPSIPPHATRWKPSQCQRSLFTREMTISTRSALANTPPSTSPAPNSCLCRREGTCCSGIMPKFERGCTSSCGSTQMEMNSKSP